MQDILLMTLSHSSRHPIPNFFNSNFTSFLGPQLDALQRPYMDYFLSELYPYYDIAIWSQTSWRWLELKVTELGMMTSESYKICFVLDKSNMFKVRLSAPYS